MRIESKTRAAIAILVAGIFVSGIAGCNPRGRECSAIVRVLDDYDTEKGSADAGASPDMAVIADRAVGQLDAIGVKDPSLTGGVVKYRAAAAEVATNARALSTELPGFLAMFPPDAGPPPLIDLDDVQRRATALVEACLFPETPDPDCDAIVAILEHASKPAPGGSMSEHLLACATSLESLAPHDPKIANGARVLAAAARAAEPRVRGMKVPAAEVFARGMRTVRASSALSKSRATADTRAADLRAQCSKTP